MFWDGEDAIASQIALKKSAKEMTNVVFFLLFHSNTNTHTRTHTHTTTIGYILYNTHKAADKRGGALIERCSGEKEHTRRLFFFSFVFGRRGNDNNKEVKTKNKKQ